MLLLAKSLHSLTNNSQGLWVKAKFLRGNAKHLRKNANALTYDFSFPSHIYHYVPLGAP